MSKSLQSQLLLLLLQLLLLLAFEDAEAYSSGLTPSESSYSSGSESTFESTFESEAEAEAASSANYSNHSKCITILYLADLNKNNQLDRSEFVIATNHLSGNRFNIFQNFYHVDGMLQATFDQLSCPNSTYIDITGVAPQSSPTVANLQLLSDTCATLEAAIHQLQIQAQAKLPVVQSRIQVRQSSTTSSSTSFVTCKIAMVVTDRDRNDILDQDEYLNFCNKLGSDQFGTELPSSLLQTYSQLATSGVGIVITGSKPGANPTQEQQDSLNTTCTVVTAAINDAASPTTPTTNTALPSTSSPTPVPTTKAPTSTANGPSSSSPSAIPISRSPASTPLPTTSFSICIISMTISDRDKNDLLDTTEYVIFINRISKNGWPDTLFDDLPTPLMDNYDLLVNSKNEGINVTGSKPGVTPTDAQAIILDNICLSTDVAIDLSRPTVSPATTAGPTSKPPTTSAPTSERPSTSKPTPAPSTLAPTSKPPSTNAPTSKPPSTPSPTTKPSSTPSPTTKPSTSAPTSKPPSTSAPTSKPPSTSAPTSKPPSTSAPTSKPPSTSTPSTSAPTTITKSPTSQPPLSTLPTTNAPETSAPTTIAPSTSKPTSLATTSIPTVLTSTKSPAGPSQEIDGSNTFVLANDMGYDSAYLNNGMPPDRELIDAAYNRVVQDVIRTEFRSATILLRRRRRLVVSYTNARTITFTDQVCPSSSNSTTLCQAVEAGYTLILSPDDDGDAIVNKYNVAIDDAIKAGKLQDALTFFASPFMVLGDAPVEGKPTMPPSAVTSVVPTSESGPTSSSPPSVGSTANSTSITPSASPVPPPSSKTFFTKGSTIGVIIGGAVALLLMAALFNSSRRRRRRRPERKDTLNDIEGANGMIRNSMHDYDDDDDDDDSSNPRKKSSYNDDHRESAVNAYGQLEDDSEDKAPKGTTRKEPIKGGFHDDFDSDEESEDYKDFNPQTKKTPVRGSKQKEVDEDSESDSESESSNSTEQSPEGGELHCDNSTKTGEFESYEFDDPIEKQKLAQYAESSSESDDEESDSGWDDEEGKSDEDDSSSDEYLEEGATADTKRNSGAVGVKRTGRKSNSESEKDEEESESDRESSKSERESEEESARESNEDSAAEESDDDSESEDDSKSDAETPVVTANRQQSKAKMQKNVSKGATAAAAGKVSSKGHKSDTETEDDSSDSYTDSDNNTYEEGTYEGTMDDSADHVSVAASEAMELARQASERLEAMQDDNSLKKMRKNGLLGRDEMSEAKSMDMDDLVKKGDWDGIINSATEMERNLDDGRAGDESEPGSASESDDSENSSDSKSESSSFDSGDSSSESGTVETGDASTNLGESTDISELPSHLQRKEEIRAEVEALVRLVVPDEVDNIDTMMTQFRGREEELLQTLRTMQERSVTARARAAVHKSKGRPPPRREQGSGYRRDGTYSIDSRQTGDSETSRGSAAGSAAIAAASIPRPATGRVPIHPPPVPTHEINETSEESSPESQKRRIGNRGRSQLQSRSNDRESDSDSTSEDESASKSESDESASESESEEESASESESESETSASESRESKSTKKSSATPSSSSSSSSSDSDSRSSSEPKNNRHPSRMNGARAGITEKSKPWGHQSGSDDDGTPGVSVGHYR